MLVALLHFFPKLHLFLTIMLLSLQLCVTEKNKTSPNYIFMVKKARYLLYFELRTHSDKTWLTTALNSRLEAATKCVKMYDVREHLVSLRRHHVASESGNWGRRNLNNTITTPCYTLPPTQHYSFFRNLPPLLKIINLRDRTSFDSGNVPFKKLKTYCLCY